MAEGISPREIIATYEQKFINALQSSLEKYGKADGQQNLWQSVKATTKIFGQKIVLEISMEDYWKFVDKGVDGTKVKHGSEYAFKSGGKPIPLSAVKSFIANRGITPAMSISKYKKASLIKGKGKLSKKLKKAVLKQNKQDELNSTAWAMGVSIKRKGIKPTHFATEVMDGNLLTQFKNDITKAVGRNIKIEIDKEIK